MIYNSTFLWFSLIFFFLFLEMGHPGLLYFLSFSCAALCACIASFYDASILSQCIAFLGGVCGTLCLLYFYVNVNKRNQLQPQYYRSNLDALIGKKIVVYQSQQDPKIWQATISGQVWIVKAVHHDFLKNGQHAVIVDVQGCHLRVDKINE